MNNQQLNEAPNKAKLDRNDRISKSDNTQSHQHGVHPITRLQSALGNHRVA